MVWGVEQTVQLPTGGSRRTAEVVADIFAHQRNLRPLPEPPVPVAPIAYEAFRLQRGALLSEIDGKPVEPRTDLLRFRLDSTPTWYYVNEEEVPKAGTRLTLAYNRTRWRDGRVSVWLSARRGSGRGEGSSALTFDHVVDTPLPE